MSNAHNVILEHAPNGDLYDSRPTPGYWSTPTDPQKMIVPCSGIAEAVEIFNQWRDRNGLGGGNMTRDCGKIHSFYGFVAQISYNGRVWKKKSHGKIATITRKSRPSNTTLLSFSNPQENKTPLSATCKTERGKLKARQSLKGDNNVSDNYRPRNRQFLPI